MNILKSSRRLAMLLVVFTACVGFLKGLVTPDLFMGLVMSLVVYKATNTSDKTPA